MLYIPGGSTIHAIATYDNTSNNPDNPNDPPEYVFWGEGTTDEMFFLPILYVPYNEGDENLPLGDIENLMGDVNFDSELNVLDVVLIVGYILDSQYFSDDQILIADINEDETIDILDIVVIINQILS